MDSNRIALESNEMLLRIFVSAIGYDYIAHHEKHTAQVQPTHSSIDMDEIQKLFGRLDD